MNTTAFGKKTLFETNVEAAKAELGKHKAITDAEMKLYDTLNGMVGKIDTEALAKGLGAAIDGFRDVLPGLQDFGAGLMGVLKPIAGILVSKDFTELSKSVLGVATDMTTILKPAIKFLADDMKLAMKGASDLINNLRGNKSGTEPKNSWQWGDPFFETKEQAKAREIYSGMPGMQRILGFNAPLFETREHLAKRALWSAMPDLGFNASKGPGPAAMAGSDAFKYGIGGDKGAKKEKADNSAANEASDVIVRGGGKSIIINMNAPMYKVEHQTFQSIKDAIKDFEPKVQEALWRILNTVPA